MDIVWCNSLAEVEQHEAAYLRFLARIGDRGLFYELERVRIMAPAFARMGGQFAWLLAWEGGELVGLAPLRLERKNLARARARVLGAFGKVGGATSQWFGDWVIPDEARIEPVLRAFREALEGPFADRWDVVEMDYLQRGHRVTRRMPEVWGEVALTEEPGYIIATELNADIETFAARFDKKFRKELKRETRKAARAWGPMRVEERGTLSDADWAVVEQMHLARQGNVRGRGAERMDLFEIGVRAEAFRAWVDMVSAQGRGRHYWIYFGEHLAGFMLGLARGASLFLQLTALDEAYAKVSPVRLLMWELLQHEAARGTMRVEMGTGENLFKRQFGTVRMELARFHYVNPQRLGARLRGTYLGAIRKLRAVVDEARKERSTREY